MMSPLVWLLILCGTMFSGSFLAGHIPLTLSLSESRLRLLSAFGAGLLIGTVLIVIIPEGVATVYDIHPALHRAVKAPIRDVGEDEAAKIPNLARRHLPSGDHQDDNQGQHKLVGLAMTLGFAFMFLIDQMSVPFQMGHISITDLHTSLPTKPRRSTLSIGLIIHAAADGIALGAAFATHQPRIELVVFLAIILHKAPAAFGLCTHLLREGQTRLMIQRNLAMFSLAAPVMSLVTYLVLLVAGPGEQTDWWKTLAGAVLLFSGGTFLYVATVHGLRELSQSTCSSGVKRMERGQALLLFLGMIFPLVISVQE